MKVKITIELKILERWASVEDFAKELEKFNEANSEVMYAEIKDIEEVKDD